MAEQSSLVRLQDEWDIDVDWRGYELHPETPKGGMALRDKFGPRIDAMHARLKGFAAEFGITDFRPRDRSPNTRKALCVAEYARDEGRLDAFRHLAMNAHWRRGMDLEADADLRQLALEAGLDPEKAIEATGEAKYLERIRERREEAESRGITGIPTFVVGRMAVVGCQPYESLAKLLERAGAKRR